MKKYYPILVSKNGEIGALQHLEQKVKDDICPIVEVLKTTLVKNKKDKATKEGTTYYSDKLEVFLKTHWNFFNNRIILDFSLFEDFNQHKDFIAKMIGRLFNSGVNIVPSVQTNSTQNYKDIIRGLIEQSGCDLCFRFSNSSGGFIHMNDDIKELMNFYNTDISSNIVLVDLGQVERFNYNTLGSSVGIILQNLNYSLEDFNSVVLASSSFPATLGDFEPRNDVYKISRYEWSLYNVVARGDLTILKYGDYGTKTADFQDVNYMGSISLKYSAPKEYLIYRGIRTIDHELGHNQFIAHSRNLIEESDYSGNDFSWGDLRYYEISRQDLENGSPGNSTQWVQFSQNHHITLMHSML